MNPVDLIKNIEQKLGNYKKLPDFPFNNESNFAVFPSLNEKLIDESLYKALFGANELMGNKSFIAKTLLDIKGRDTSLIQQDKLDWDSFERFQNAPLAYDGLYITGDQFNWLGIYHTNDYVIIGGSREFINVVCNKVYGSSDWLSEFESAFKNGRMDMYKEDYDALKEGLLKK